MTSWMGCRTTETLVTRMTMILTLTVTCSKSNMTVTMTFNYSAAHVVHTDLLQVTHCTHSMPCGHTKAYIYMCTTIYHALALVWHVKLICRSVLHSFNCTHSRCYACCGRVCTYTCSVTIFMCCMHMNKLILLLNYQMCYY